MCVVNAKTVLFGTYYLFGLLLSQRYNTSWFCCWSFLSSFRFFLPDSKMVVASIIIQKPQQMMFQLLADKKELMELKIATPFILFSKSFPPVIIVRNVLFSTLNLKKVKQVACCWIDCIANPFFSLSIGRRTSRCENSETNNEQKRERGGGKDSREDGVKNKRVNSCVTLLQKNHPFPHSTLPH